MNSMSKREKILAGSVGLLLLVAAVYMLWPTGGGFFSAQKNRIKLLQTEVGKLDD